MLSKSLFATAVLALACWSGISGTQDEVKPDLTGVKCPLMPKKEVKETFSADYAGAKVFFCCKMCQGNFNKDPEKFATVANKNLVETKQFKQTTCPLSGGKLNPETEVKVGGVGVQFCCNNCKGKVEGEKDEKAQAELVFGKDAFKKGFAKVEPKKD